MRRLAIIGLSILATLAALPATADAADTVINFDNLPAGTVVKDQYQGSGLRLSRALSGDVGQTPETKAAVPGPGNVLELDGDCGPEFCSGFLLSGRLDFQRQHLRVTVTAPKVGSGDGGFQGPPTLRALDGQGNTIGQTTMPANTPVPYTLDFTSPSQNIQFFEVGGVKAIDDLTYDNPANPPPPDFAVFPQFPPFQGPDSVRIKAGSQLTVNVLLNRYNLSSGPIGFTSLLDTTTGITATSGVTTTGPDGTLVPITIKVPASSGPKTIPLTIRAHAESIAAGPTNVNRDITFNIVAFRDYDLQTTGIEVTQGIQRELIRCTNAADCDSNFSLPFRNPAAPTAAVPYNGFFPFPYFESTLVAGKRTVARVFANVRDPAFPNGIAVERVGMRLRGFGAGGELKESPLAAEQGPGIVRSGGPGSTAGGSGQPFVTFKDRVDPKGAYQFTLPDSWTHQKLTLRAELVPPDDLELGGQQSSKECSSSACKANNEFILSDIPFHNVGSTRVAFAWLYTDADGPFAPAIPAQLTPYAGVVLPFAEGDLRTDASYYADVNVQEAVDDNPDSDRDAMYDAKDILEDYASDYPGCEYLDFCAEIISGIMSTRITTRGTSDSDYPGVNVAPIGRTPSIAHEISHNLGREHSGENCPGIGENGQTAEDWPPDERGLIHGIGLDTRPSSGGFYTYRVIAPNNLGAPDSPGVPLLDFPLKSPTPTITAQPEWFDQQSYCRRSDSLIDQDRWTSVLGLERFFVPNGFVPGVGVADVVPPTLDFDKLSLKAAAAAAPRKLLHVQALAGPGVTPEITVVKERTLRPRTMPATSPYHLIARNAAGGVLADVPMEAKSYPPDPQVQLTGQAPVTGAASVEVTFNGAVIASRARSAATPTVRILAPRRGQRVGAGRGVTVRWSASDRDGGKLRAKVDYSFDDGRNWTVLFVGRNTGRTTIPSEFLSASRRAKVRVRISDGFNEGQATSARFVAVGRPPKVRIASPGRNQRIAADAWLSLSAQATDDRRRRLRGRSLRWFDGRRLIATGDRASVVGLRPGRRRIRVVARDSAGRTRSAAVTVRVLAVPPQFLTLSAPRRVSSRARSVTLRVRTNVPATLTVGGRRFPVGRRARRVRVPVFRGIKALSLLVRVRAGRFTARRTVVVARSGGTIPTRGGG
jgi:hypothetical protein